MNVQIPTITLNFLLQPMFLKSILKINWFSDTLDNEIHKLVQWQFLKVDCSKCFYYNKKPSCR